MSKTKGFLYWLNRRIKSYTKINQMKEGYQIVSSYGSGKKIKERSFCVTNVLDEYTP